MNLAFYPVMDEKPSSERPRWPALPYDGWKATLATLHRWVQIAGKVRLASVPWMNHSWQATLYVTARGLTTSPIPHGTGVFSIDFDFIDHELFFLTSTGAKETIPLRDQSVAEFYERFRAILGRFGIRSHFCERPNEVADATPFAADRSHCVYERQAVENFHQALIQADRVLKIFRSGFIGKCSPVHFFWGSFDLAVTRFSGRRAPMHPGGIPALPDRIVREAYSHEVSSCGFWPGNDLYPRPAFYAYAYPAPPGFESHEVSPPTARYEASLREFILPYDDVRRAENPDEILLRFFESTYEAAAILGHWHRESLEESPYLRILQTEQERKIPRPEGLALETKTPSRPPGPRLIDPSNLH